MGFPTETSVMTPTAQHPDSPIGNSPYRLRNAAVDDMTVTQAFKLLHLHHNWEVVDALGTYIRGYLDCARDARRGGYGANFCARSAIRCFSDHGAWRQGCEDAWNSLQNTRREAAMVKVVDHVHLGLSLGNIVVPDDTEEEKELEAERQQQVDQGASHPAEDGSPDTADASAGGDVVDNNVEIMDSNYVGSAAVNRPLSPLSRYLQAMTKPRPVPLFARPRQHFTFAGAQGLFGSSPHDAVRHHNNDDDDEEEEDNITILASSTPSRPESSREGSFDVNKHADDGCHDDQNANQQIRSPSVASSPASSPGSEYLPSTKSRANQRQHKNQGSSNNSNTAKGDNRVIKTRLRPKKKKENHGRGHMVKKDEVIGGEYDAWPFERILDSRWDATKMGIEYRVQWTYHKPSWQPARDLVDNPEEVAGFHRSRPQKPGPPAWFATARL